MEMEITNRVGDVLIFQGHLMQKQRMTLEEDGTSNKILGGITIGV